VLASGPLPPTFLPWHHRCRSKFLGMRKIFADISQTRKNFGPLFVWIVSHDNRFRDDLQKRLHIILYTLSAFFSNKSTLDAIFAQILRKFWQIFADFARIFRDFVRIFTKSKLLGVLLPPCTPASYTTAWHKPLVTLLPHLRSLRFIKWSVQVNPLHPLRTIC